MYDRIPKVLRVQVSNLLVGALGTTDEYHRPNSRELYEIIRNETMHEHGRHWLASKHAPAQDDIIKCIENELSLPVWLDLVELSFRCIEKICGNYDRYKRRELEITTPADEAIQK